jgi:hypothetical protein
VLHYGTPQKKYLVTVYAAKVINDLGCEMYDFGIIGKEGDIVNPKSS